MDISENQFSCGVKKIPSFVLAVQHKRVKSNYTAKYCGSCLMSKVNTAQSRLGKIEMPCAATSIIAPANYHFTERTRNNCILYIDSGDKARMSCMKMKTEQINQKFMYL